MRVSRVYVMFALPLLAGLPLAGCGDPPRDAGPLKVVVHRGEAPGAPQKPPAYKFQFVETSKAEHHLGDAIAYRIALDVPDGESPPSVVILHLMQGEVIVDSKLLEPASGPEPAALRFEGELRPPPSAGTYALRVEAIQSHHYYSTADRKGSAQDVVVHSPRVPIRVKH